MLETPTCGCPHGHNARQSTGYLGFCVMGVSMKKFLIATTAILALLSAAGCAGKAPIGKAPVVAKG